MLNKIRHFFWMCKRKRTSYWTRIWVLADEAVRTAQELLGSERQMDGPYTDAYDPLCVTVFDSYGEVLKRHEVKSVSGKQITFWDTDAVASWDDLDTESQAALADYVINNRNKLSINN